MRKKTEKSVEITLKETSVGTPSGEIKFVEGVDSKNLPICIVKPQHKTNIDIDWCCNSWTGILGLAKPPASKPEVALVSSDKPEQYKPCLIKGQNQSDVTQAPVPTSTEIFFFDN